MIRPPHDFPGIAVIVDETSPGQRLVSHTQTPSARPLAQLRQIGRRPADATQCLGMDRRTDQDKVGTKVLHQVELAFRPVESLVAQASRQSFEIAEWLEQHDLKPMVAYHPADLSGVRSIRNEVLFEDLDPVEPGSGDGFQLVAKAPRYRNGGDGCFHDRNLARQSCGR